MDTNHQTGPRSSAGITSQLHSEAHLTIDRHAEARRQIASDAAATEAKQRQLEAIHQSVRFAECGPLDSADSDHELDPLLMDRPPSRRSKIDADRLLSILDELEQRTHE